MHLAELNLSVWKINPFINPVAKGFLDNVDRVNALAERSEGFVWRLQDEGRDENGRTILGGPDLLMTLSVWETPKHLAHFVWNTVHKKIYNRKEDWFKRMDSHHLVMWWVEEGHRPDLAEAKERLDHLNSVGESEFAFAWEFLKLKSKPA